MDLRIQKTLKVIRTSFMELAQNKAVEKITVKELCEHAMINKATFYSHYDNITTLIEEIEDEFVSRLTGDIDYTYLFFTDPEKFIERLLRTFWDIPDGRYLLAGSRNWALLSMLLETLRRSIYKERPEIKSVPGIDMAISYIISGFSGVITMHSKESITQRAHEAGRATAAILQEFLVE